jgi:hypothetical protein
MHATSAARVAATACLAVVLASFGGARAYAQAGSQSFRLSLSELDAITAGSVHATLTTTAYAAGSQRSTADARGSVRGVDDHSVDGKSTSAYATATGLGTASTSRGTAVTASENRVTVDAGSDAAVEVHAVTMGTASGGYATSKSKTATEAKDGPKRDVATGLASSSSVGDKTDTTASVSFSIDGNLISTKSSTTEDNNDKKSLTVTRTTSLYKGEDGTTYRVVIVDREVETATSSKSIVSGRLVSSESPPDRIDDRDSSLRSTSIARARGRI